MICFYCTIKIRTFFTTIGQVCLVNQALVLLVLEVSLKMYGVPPSGSKMRRTMTMTSGFREYPMFRQTHLCPPSL